MSKRILWLVGGEKEAVFVARLTDLLSREYRYTSVLFTFLEGTRARLREMDCCSLSLNELLQAKADVTPKGKEAIDAANELLGRMDINMLLHSDQLFYLFVDHGTAQVTIARVVLAIYAFLSQGNYAGCLRYGTGGAIGRAMSIVAESQGLRSYALCSCVGFNTCGLIPAGLEEQWRWTAFPRHWQTWQNRTVPEPDRERIDTYIASYYKLHKARPRTRLEQTMPQAFRQPGRWERFKNRLIPWRQSGPSEECTQIVSENILDDGNLDALVPLWESYLSQLKSQWIETYRRFNYDQIPNRYVYMPLNFSWDAPHRAWNPMNYLQEYLVKIVAASLPYGYQLVIKEHPYGLGDPSHKKLEELQEIGVKVVDPHTHSLEVIKHAEAVFCVGDTTGWEAILFKVPVIVFGARPFYTDYPYLWAITDPNDVHHALREAVKSKYTAYSDQNLWYAFIQSALESSYAGNIWGYKGLVWVDADESEENLRNIADMIAKEGDF